MSIATGLAVLPLAAIAQPTKTWDGYSEVTEAEQYFLATLNLNRSNPQIIPDLSLYYHQQFYSDARVKDEDVYQHVKEVVTPYESRPPLVYLKEAVAEASSRLAEMEPILLSNSYYAEEVASSELLPFAHFFHSNPTAGTLFETEFEPDIYVGAALSNLVTTQTTLMGRYVYDRGESAPYRIPSSVTAYVAGAYQDLDWTPIHIFNSIYVSADKYPSRPYDDTVWITGTVYRDGNGNGRYDPGEQVPGVEIVPDRGEYMAVSAPAGGYAIPFRKSAVGPIAVTAKNADGWTKTYELELKEFSSRSGDGGLWLDVKLPPDHKPARYDYIKAYGWASEEKPFEIEIEIEGYAQYKRLLFVAQVGHRPLMYAGPYDDDGLLRSDADPRIVILDTEENVIAHNDRWTADDETGLSQDNVSLLRRVIAGDSDITQYRSSAVGVWLKPGKYRFVIESVSQEGPVLAQIFETDFEQLGFDPPDRRPDYALVAPELRTTRISSVRIVDESNEGFPRHMEASGSSFEQIPFRAKLGLGNASLEVEGSARNTLKLSPVKGGVLNMAAEIRVGDLDHLSYSVSHDQLQGIIMEFKENDPEPKQ